MAEVEKTGIEESVEKTGQEAGQESTPNWEKTAKGYEEGFKSLGYENFDGLKGEFTTYKTAAETAYDFLNSNPEALKLYNAYKSGEKIEPAEKVVDKGKKQDSGFDPEAFRAEALNPLESKLQHQERVLNDIQAKEEKREAQAKYSWLDDKTWQEMDARFAKRANTEIQNLISYGDNPQDATRKVKSRYRDFTVDDFVSLFMQDKLIENAASQKRGPVSLPDAMKGVGKGGISPTALDQAKKEYESAPRGMEEGQSTWVVKKWAEQLGKTPTEMHKILTGAE